MPKLTDYDAVETLKPNISPNLARGMFGGPLGTYKVNPTMVGGVNNTVKQIRPALSVMLVAQKLILLCSVYFRGHNLLAPT